MPSVDKKRVAQHWLSLSGTGDFMIQGKDLDLAWLCKLWFIQLHLPASCWLRSWNNFILGQLFLPEIKPELSSPTTRNRQVPNIPEDAFQQMCHSSCAWRLQGLVRPPRAQITCILYKGPSAVLFITDCHTAVSASLHFLPRSPWQTELFTPSLPQHTLVHYFPSPSLFLLCPTSSSPSFLCNPCFPAMNISSLPLLNSNISQVWPGMLKQQGVLM